MIRDRDRIYGAVVTRRLRAERLIGSIRRECLDHMIVLGDAHLRILKSYADYYNSVRTHRSLHKDAPISRPIHQTGIIRSHPILGGLHHHSHRMRIILSERQVNIFNLAKNAVTLVDQIERFYARGLSLSKEMARNLQSFGSG
jgi:hypothetical protein